MLYDDTNPDWVPSRNLGYSEASNGKPSRYERARGRQTKRKELQDKEDSEAKKSRIESYQAAESEDETGIAVQTDFTHHKFDELELEIKLKHFLKPSQETI